MPAAPAGGLPSCEPPGLVTGLVTPPAGCCLRTALGLGFGCTGGKPALSSRAACDGCAAPVSSSDTCSLRLLPTPLALEPALLLSPAAAAALPAASCSVGRPAASVLAGSGGGDGNLSAGGAGNLVPSSCCCCCCSFGLGLAGLSRCLPRSSLPPSGLSLRSALSCVLRPLLSLASRRLSGLLLRLRRRSLLRLRLRSLLRLRLLLSLCPPLRSLLRLRLRLLRSLLLLRLRLSRLWLRGRSRCELRPTSRSGRLLSLSLPRSRSCSRSLSPAALRGCCTECMPSSPAAASLACGRCWSGCDCGWPAPWGGALGSSCWRLRLSSCGDRLRLRLRALPGAAAAAAPSGDARVDPAAPFAAAPAAAPAAACNSKHPVPARPTRVGMSDVAAAYAWTQA